MQLIFIKLIQGGFWRWIYGAENDCFWTFLGAYKRHTPLHIGLLSTQICTHLRGVRNPWEIGGNPLIGGKEYTQLYTVFHYSNAITNLWESGLQVARS